jgi:predicted small secreted protein
MMRLSRLGAESGRRPLLGLIVLVIASSFVVTGCDRLTGGGWIQSAAVLSGGKATFGFSAKCRDTTVDGVPIAELYDGQFQFDDRSFNPRVRVHGDVEPNVFGTAPGQTCRQVANDLHVVRQQLSGFQGTYRTQPAVVPSSEGEFAVSVFDAGEGGNLLDDDQLCVDLTGGVTYFNCGPVQGGNIQVN